MKRIIAGFAGVGKTKFCEMNKDIAIDLIVMPYKYSNYNEFSNETVEKESIKANKNLEFNPFWHREYIDTLKKIYFDDSSNIKFIVIPTDLCILRMLDKSDIPYTVVIPDISLKSEYENRYKERGNTENFISIFIGHWDEFMKRIQNKNVKTIILKTGQYLSDVIDI